MGVKSTGAGRRGGYIPRVRIPVFLVPYAIGLLGVSRPCPAHAAGIELDWAPAEALDAWTEEKRFSFKDLTADAVGIAAFVALSAAADR
jgi:hypothetical protein